jgi:hypothetical protein
MADNKNNWIAGFVVAAVVSIASIAFGASALVRADSIKTIADRQTEDSKRISILEATYPNIEKRLDAIYDLVAKHMGIK